MKISLGTRKSEAGSGTGDKCESIKGCSDKATWFHHWSCRCTPNGQLLCNLHKETGDVNGLSGPVKHAVCGTIAVGAGVYTPL